MRQRVFQCRAEIDTFYNHRCYRTSKSSDANSRKAEYTANNLNQYTQRTVPGALDVLGTANSNAAVTVNGQTATQQVAYFYKEIAVSNGTAAAWQPISVVGTLTGTGTNNPDIIVTNSGSLFLPQTPEAFTFDLDGNQTSDGRWTNTWDSENRLIAMETRADLSTNIPRQKIICQYDSRGHRVSKVVSNFTGGIWVEVSNLRFIYDGWNLLAEIGADGSAVRSYVWGLDLSGSMQGAGGVGGLLAVNGGANGTHFVTSDGNGNVVGLFKSNDCAVTATFEYDPFGNTLRATGPMANDFPLRFSTKFHDDETGLIYYPFRYYNGVCWLTRDPIEEAGCINLISFVGNNAISYIDFIGLDRKTVKFEFEREFWTNPAEPKSAIPVTKPEDIEKQIDLIIGKSNQLYSAKGEDPCNCIEMAVISSHGAGAGNVYVGANFLSSEEQISDEVKLKLLKMKSRTMVEHERAKMTLKRLANAMCKDKAALFILQCEAGHGTEGDALGKQLKNIFGNKTTIVLFEGDCGFSKITGNPIGAGGLLSSLNTKVF